MATYSGSDWDELTIREMLTDTTVKKDSDGRNSPGDHSNSRENQVKESEKEAMGPPSGPIVANHKRKRSHKKVSAKEKTLSNGSFLKFTVDVSPPLPDITMLDQTPTIHTIDAAIAECEGEMSTWPAPSPQPSREPHIYDCYSVQQKREILGALQGRVADIQSNIIAARSALEKIIRFL